MKSRTTAADVELIQKAFSNIGINAGTVPSQEKTNKESCNYILNNSGEIRWLFSSKSSKPEFLRFYFKGSKRASFIGKLYILLFKFHLKKLAVSGSFNLYVNDCDKNIFRNPNGWALFTGTAGPNRKMIFWQNKNGKNIYTKIALTNASQLLIKKEKKALEKLQETSLKEIAFPKIHSHSEKYISLEEVNIRQNIKKNSFSNIPVNTLQDWSLKNLLKENLKETNWWNKAIQNLQEALQFNDSRLSKGLFIKINYLKDYLSKNEFSFTTLAHGDFTPWNIFFDDNKIGIIDWELSEPGMPALFDIIHYIYQENILIEKNSFSIIHAKIDKIFSSPDWKFFLENNSFSAADCEMCYLFFTVSFYLKTYTAQSAWHPQVKWLLTTWNEAVSFWLYEKNILEIRKILLLDTTVFLHDKNYAAMKLTISLVEDFSDSSDIDLCLSKNDTDKLYKFYTSHILVKNTSAKRSSFMQQLCVHTINNQLLFIDCIQKFKRKSLEYLSAKRVTQNSFQNSFGMKQPDAVSDFAYIFNFYLLNNASVPEKYFLHYLSHKNEITGHLQTVNKEIKDYTAVRYFDKKIASSQISSLKKTPKNQGWHGFLNKLYYIKDSFESMASRDGFIITFSGVDGAGKTTVIDYSKEFIEKMLRKRVVVLRHRPSVLPILSAWKYGKENAVQKSVDSLPRQGKNENLLASLIRFIYYYIDYLLGQFYVQAKYVSRGYAVLYDRYYFDMINDAKRSNIELPERFLKWWYRFLLKPELNIFLFASPEEILKRKQELSAEIITTLTNRYSALFASFNKKYVRSKYISINNVDMDTTLTYLYNEIKVL